MIPFLITTDLAVASKAFFSDNLLKISPMSMFCEDLWCWLPENILLFDSSLFGGVIFKN
jgi:hypothetical protein